MGQLVDGKWEKTWYDTRKSGGRFVRSETGFRNWITPDGRPGPTGSGGFAPQSGRYHLYVSYACPWAHRTLIFRALKGLEPHIGVSVVHPDMLDDGWSFATDFPGATGDQLFGLPFLRDLYTRAQPGISGRVTVPVLWDTQDFWPEPLRDGIEAINTRIYDTLNNGVYKAGFATTQAAYDAAVGPVFDTLDWLETHLSANRYLMGDTLTEADWRLFPTLIRFDPVYHLHFKCNRARITDYPNLWAYTRALYQWPGVAGTTHLDHIVRHYHYSHETINPYRILPINPVLDLDAPHNRGG